jgi:hypothetical protein
MNAYPSSNAAAVNGDFSMSPSRSFAELPEMKYATPFCGAMRS